MDRFFDGFRDRKKQVQNPEKSEKSGPQGWPSAIEGVGAVAKEEGREEVNLLPGSEGQEVQRFRRKEGSEDKKERRFGGSERKKVQRIRGSEESRGI